MFGTHNFVSDMYNLACCEGDGALLAGGNRNAVRSRLPLR